MAGSGLVVCALLVLVLVCGVAAAQSQPSVQPSVFQTNFEVMWANDHCQTSPDGRVWNLALDQNSGSGFQSKNKYKYGWFSMKLKLVPGDSAGVVTAYYMSSNTDNRDELDFEFLGNRSGEPYVLQTNVYANGVGNREQRVFLWFDPTAKFHAYSILWNTHQIVFYVDQTPIRVHRNTPATRDVFPSSQPMSVFSSIWNADNWATRGGLEKINWEGAPFISSYEKFHVSGCQWEEPYPACVLDTRQYWWDQYPSWSLQEKEKPKLAWVRDNYLVYDYCLDKVRFETTPVECSVKAWD